MAGQGSLMFGWSLTDVSVLGSQVFGQALMESCAPFRDGLIIIIKDMTTIKVISIKRIMVKGSILNPDAREQRVSKYQQRVIVI